MRSAGLVNITRAAIAASGLLFASIGNAVTTVDFDGAKFQVFAEGSGLSYKIYYYADFTGITNANAWWNGYAAGVSLDLPNTALGVGSSASLVSTTAGGTQWNFYIDKLNSNGCSASTNDAICAVEEGYQTVPLALSLLNGNKFVWVFDVTFSSITDVFTKEHNLKFLATDGTLDNQGNWNNSGFSLVSQDITFQCCKRPPDQVPEPGTLMLLGLGLVGWGAMRRRRTA